jgi:hypothetical protein
MHKCKLCLEREANQTGSHILTSWLIIPVFSEGGSIRDYEIIFPPSSIATGRPPFIGRNVLPETIKAAIGRDMTEIELKLQNENQHPFTQDDVFCNICEKRFSVIEQEYSLIHKNKIKNNQTSQIFNIDGLTCRLFFLIQIWRTSIVKMKGFSLNKDFEKKLRNLLNDILDLDKSVLFDNLTAKAMGINQFPFYLIRLDPNIDFKFTDLNKYISRPYFAFLGEYAIILYEKQKHLNSRPSLYGIDKLLKDNWLNINKTELQIGYINATDFLPVKEAYKKFVVNEIVKIPIKIFKEAFRDKLGRKATESDISRFKHHLSHGKNEKTILKWENIEDALQKTIFPNN